MSPRWFSNIRFNRVSARVPRTRALFAYSDSTLADSATAFARLASRCADFFCSFASTNVRCAAFAALRAFCNLVLAFPRAWFVDAKLD